MGLLLRSSRGYFSRKPYRPSNYTLCFSLFNTRHNAPGHLICLVPEEGAGVQVLASECWRRGWPAFRRTAPQGLGARRAVWGCPTRWGPLCDAHSVRLRVAVRRMPEAQQRVGGCFLSLMPQMKTLYLTYCANHPSAVSVLTEHRYVSWTSSQVGGVAVSWGSLRAAHFCQMLLGTRCRH